jgi:hypothetical protein
MKQFNFAGAEYEDGKRASIVATRGETSGVYPSEFPARKQVEWFDHAGIVTEQVRAYCRKHSSGEAKAGSPGEQSASVVRIAMKYGIPLEESNILQEAGYTGTEWWLGAETRGKGKSRYQCGAPTRPILTQLINDIVSGNVRYLIVDRLNSLTQNEEMADALMRIFVAHDVLLFDRGGRIEIESLAQLDKSQAAIIRPAWGGLRSLNRKRYIRPNPQADEVVARADILGFRISKKSLAKTVTSRPEEQMLVRRIFEMYAMREDKYGVLGYVSISERLRREGVDWPGDLRRTRGREAVSGSAMSAKQVKRVLKDVRYQGRQVSGNREWPCPAFLVDGKPVVEQTLFESVQARIREASKAEQPAPECETSRKGRAS